MNTRGERFARRTGDTQRAFGGGSCDLLSRKRHERTGRATTVFRGGGERSSTRRYAADGIFGGHRGKTILHSDVAGTALSTTRLVD